MDSVGFAPCAHDEGIVVGNGGYDVNALLAQSGELGNVAWEVGGAACGGECTGEREDDDFLVGPFCEVVSACGRGEVLVGGGGYLWMHCR